MPNQLTAGDLGWYTILVTDSEPDCLVNVTFPNGGFGPAAGPSQVAGGWKWTFIVPSDSGTGDAVVAAQCRFAGDTTYGPVRETSIPIVAG